MPPWQFERRAVRGARCAAMMLRSTGITTFAPLHCCGTGTGTGHIVSVVGIGGLGHPGITFARATRCMTGS
ncbi:hypothetical protein [Xanthomonas hortorum]|uniref:hypothetical protein n=2 Tax=Xanthomonas TaxID=338 RepID=UPI0020CFE694|nr:hypothetical protein [Xanthomonas hortorum]UTS71331.1 hypothetical protein NMB96_12235 [Xanthomonas hortorum]